MYSAAELQDQAEPSVAIGGAGKIGLPSCPLHNCEYWTGTGANLCLCVHVCVRVWLSAFVRVHACMSKDPCGMSIGLLV